jgi:hypothetical protein
MQAEPRARVNLKDLVYTALDAIQAANMQMSNNMLATIKKFSDDVGHEKGTPLWQLKTIELVYNQIRNDDLDMLCTEKIGLKVPLLALMPLSNLKVSRSKIQFSTEVEEVDFRDGKVDIYTKVTSADSDRSQHSSRIDFEIEMESDPVAEGLARVIDQLSQNFLPDVRETVPIDSQGKPLDESGKASYLRRKKLNKREKRISRQLERINEIERMQQGEYVKQGKSFEDMEVDTDLQDLKRCKEKLETMLAKVRMLILKADIAYLGSGKKKENEQQSKTPTK